MSTQLHEKNVIPKYKQKGQKLMTSSYFLRECNFVLLYYTNRKSIRTRSVPLNNYTVDIFFYNSITAIREMEN